MLNLVSINENELPVRDFDENSTIAVIREPIKFKTSFGVVETKDLFFYRNSSDIAEVGLDYPVEVNSVIGIVKVWDFIAFHENGNISEMRLVNEKLIPTLFGNIRIKDTVKLYPNGAIKSVISSGDNDLNICTWFRDGDAICFLPDGSLHIS